jgi:Ubiquitin-like modifier-activating enzyme ATG7 N-terminus
LFADTAELAITLGYTYLERLDLLPPTNKMALKFAPFGSEIELPFYDNLSQSKIDHDKLDDSARRVLGLYEPRVTSAPDESCKMMVLGNALTSEEWAFDLIWNEPRLG